MKLILTYTLFASCILFSLTAYGQYTEVINSNRPGVSRSAYSVGTGVIQLELGGFSIKEDHSLLDFEASGFGIDFAGRYGLFFEALEVSVEGIYRNDTFTSNRPFFTSDRKRSNFTNLTIGAKYLVYDPLKNAEEDKPNLYSYHANRKFKWKSLIPAVAVYAGANFDSENNPFIAPDTEGISPKVLISTQNNFVGGWVFVTNFILDRIGTDASDFQYILTLTHSFNTKWVVFAETQGIKGDFYSDNLFRFGGAYLFGRNFQLDTGVTFNTKNTPSVFNITLGASYRLDFHKDKEIPVKQ